MDRERGKALLARGSVDLAPLDAVVAELVWKLANTFPGCLTKTVESVRKHKLEHWDRNKESNRAWLQPSPSMRVPQPSDFRRVTESRNP